MPGSLNCRGSLHPSLGSIPHATTFSSKTTDLEETGLADNRAVHSGSNASKSHLTDLQSVLEISDDNKRNPNVTVMQLQRPPFDFPAVDTSDPSRDMQSDLFLLDQAMQPQLQSSSRQDGLLPLHNTTSSINMPGSEIEASDSLFGEAMNRATPAICPNLFDDMVGHSKLLGMDGATDVSNQAQQFSNQRLFHQQGHNANSSNPHKHGDASSGVQESSDLECILQELGIISSQGDRENNYPKDHLMRPMPVDVPRFFKEPLGHDLHPSGHMAFGKQKKRRHSALSSEPHASIGDADIPGQMAKRAKSDFQYGGGGLNFPDRGPPKAVYMGHRSMGARKEARSYSLLSGTNSGRLSSAGGSAGGFAERTESARPHPDLYENLSPDQQLRVDHLREKISKMPRRKLRESLARGVSIDEVEPLMSVNRDDLAEMLGLGVTTWKIFIHHTFGIPRWPARVFKSQDMREKSLKGRLREAEARGDAQATAELWAELKKLQEKRRKGRNNIRVMARKFREKVLSSFGKGHAK